MNRFTCAALILALIAPACDEPPIVPPPELLKEPPTQEPTSRPTTQQLLEGPRRQIPLASMPLTARVPPGWSVKNMEGTSVTTFLEGPTPSGDAIIQLVERAGTTSEKLQILVDGASREMKQFPDSMRMAELRDIPGAKVLERQRIGRLASPSLSEPGVKESPPFNWTISIFIPRGADNYETCELNFIGLTVDQYEADKALLRDIVDSLTVNDAGPTTNTTTTPASP